MKRDLRNWNRLIISHVRKYHLFLFAIAVGDDGAPGIGMPVLILFINAGERIANNAEQFLLFGADVDENSGIVTIYFWEISLTLWPCKKFFWKDVLINK